MNRSLFGIQRFLITLSVKLFNLVEQISLMSLACDWIKLLLWLSPNRFGTNKPKGHKKPGIIWSLWLYKLLYLLKNCSFDETFMQTLQLIAGQKNCCISDTHPFLSFICRYFLRWVTDLYIISVCVLVLQQIYPIVPNLDKTENEYSLIGSWMRTNKKEFVNYIQLDCLMIVTQYYHGNPDICCPRKPRYG